MGMTILRGSKVKTVILVFCLIICILSHAGVCGNSNSLTFFGWSDQHVKTDGDGEHLIPAIDAMNILSQKAYPASIGGKVDEPNFVIGLGDITEWPTRAAKNTYQQLITGRLRFPSYDVAGNHDSGGRAQSPTIHDWLIKRHGSLSYTFHRKGVLFVALYSKYDESLNSPAQPISEDALGYLQMNLSKVPEGTPIVVATHLCFESITNKDEFIDAFGDALTLKDSSLLHLTTKKANGPLIQRRSSTRGSEGLRKRLSVANPPRIKMLRRSASRCSLTPILETVSF